MMLLLHVYCKGVLRSQPQVSKHLGVLRKAGVVDVEPVARHRLHHLRGEAFAEIGDWLNSFEELLEARLDSLEAFLRSREGLQ